jgi:trans-AT polyketide synthase/acyltransferase/oxidoreductase domain-containing protein
MQEKLAYLFPAFVLKYTGKEYNLIVEKHQFDLDTRIADSGRLLGLDIETFDIQENSFLDSELENQILSYIFSCSFSDILHSKGKEADLISGFSMGIYSALYHAGVIDFNTGLLLIRDVFSLVQKLLRNENFIMASVVGFTREEINDYIKSEESVEIVIQNGTYSYVISGKEKEVKTLMDIFQEEGAIYLSMFNLSSPYHAKVLRNNALEFEHLVRKYSFSDPIVPVLSMIDQAKLRTAEQLRTEIVRNVSQPLNFSKSIQSMNEQGVKHFVEVGADTSLLKSSKFIDGDFDFKAISRGKWL